MQGVRGARGVRSVTHRRVWQGPIWLRASNWLRFVILREARGDASAVKMPSLKFAVDRCELIPCEVCSNWHNRMRLAPKNCGNDEGIDTSALPPGALVAAPVQFTVVQLAEGDGEAVADLPPHRALLGKLDVVGIRRGSAADETGLRGYKLQMFAVALTYWLADNADRLLAQADPVVTGRYSHSHPHVSVRRAQRFPVGSTWQ